MIRGLQSSSNCDSFPTIFTTRITPFWQRSTAGFGSLFSRRPTSSPVLVQHDSRGQSFRAPLELQLNIRHLHKESALTGREHLNRSLIGRLRHQSLAFPPEFQRDVRPYLILP